MLGADAAGGLKFGNTGPQHCRAADAYASALMSSDLSSAMRRRTSVSTVPKNGAHRTEIEQKHLYSSLPEPFWLLRRCWNGQRHLLRYFKSSLWQSCPGDGTPAFKRDYYVNSK